MLIKGEPGTGKSTLLLCAERACKAADIPILCLCGNSFSVNTPFIIADQLVAKFARDHDSQAVEAALVAVSEDSQDVAWLAKLLPSLPEVPPAAAAAAAAADDGAADGARRRRSLDGRRKSVDGRPKRLQRTASMQQPQSPTSFDASVPMEPERERRKRVVGRCSLGTPA